MKMSEWEGSAADEKADRAAVRAENEGKHVGVFLHAKEVKSAHKKHGSIRSRMTAKRSED